MAMHLEITLVMTWAEKEKEESNIRMLFSAARLRWNGSK